MPAHPVHSPRSRRHSREATVAPQPTARPSRARRLAFGLVALLGLAVALVFDPRLGGAFRLTKALAAQALGLASLVALALAGRPAGGTGGIGGIGGARPGPRSGWRAWLDAPAVAAAAPLLLVATLLAPASAHPEHVARGLAGLWIGAACLVGWSIGFSRQELARLLVWTIPGAALSGLLGLLQAGGVFQPFGLDLGAEPDVARRSVIGLAGNPGDLGASLVLPALVAQAAALHRFARRREGGRGWIVWASVAALVSVAVVATQTIAAIGALVVGTLLLWAPQAGRRLRWIAAGTLALALLAPLASAGIRERAGEKLREVARGDWNALLSGRLDGWRGAVEMLRGAPFTGVGVGAYRAEFVDAKARLLGRGTEFFAQQPYPVFANAHSEPLEIGAEIGVPGLLALLWGFVVVGRRLARRGADPAGRGLATGGAVALLLLASTGFPFRIAAVGFPALLFLAWLLATEPAEEAA